MSNSINPIVLTEEEISGRFDLAMRRNKKLFGDHAFRKSIPGTRRCPINKALFETWSILIEDLSESQFEQLLNNKVSFFADYQALFSNNDFIYAVSRNSLSTWSVHYRYDTLQKLINKYTI